MLEFMKADPTVNHIELDGHSDNSGNRLTNRDLSRRRALAVMEFFKANGIQESQITLRFHGERYPLAPNTNCRQSGEEPSGQCAPRAGCADRKAGPSSHCIGERRVDLLNPL